MGAGSYSGDRLRRRCPRDCVVRQYRDRRAVDVGPSEFFERVVREGVDEREIGRRGVVDLELVRTQRAGVDIGRLVVRVRILVLVEFGGHDDGREHVAVEFVGVGAAALRSRRRRSDPVGRWCRRRRDRRGPDRTTRSGTTRSGTASAGVSWSPRPDRPTDPPAPTRSRPGPRASCRFRSRSRSRQLRATSPAHLRRRRAASSRSWSSLSASTPSASRSCSVVLTR